MIELLRNRVKRLHLALQNLAFPINHYKHKTWSNGIYPEIKRLRSACKKFQWDEEYVHNALTK